MNRHDTLLLVSASADNRKLLRSMLEENYNLLESSNSQQAALLLRQNSDCIAAVLLDTSDPSDISPAMMTREPFDAFAEHMPFIIFLASDSHEEQSEAFSYGASEVIPLGYDSEIALRRIENIVNLNLHERQLEVLVREQADLLRSANDAMVDALTSIIEYRSAESGQHILRIRHFTRILLEEVARCCPEYGLSRLHIDIISSASALHDIGKIAIPDAILTKPGKLTPDEWEIMKTHCDTGCRILAGIGDMGNPEYVRYAHNICHYHHERWDGRGYPEGLSGESIPICAQVTGLADAYDALTSKRVYKEAYSCTAAVNMILNGECGMFSPKLLECFKRVTDQLEALAHSYADGMSPHAEEFDVTLPDPQENDSLNLAQSKYQALIHYLNGFFMEVDLDSSIFHVIYNPYPELARLRSISSSRQLEQLLEENAASADPSALFARLRAHVMEFLDKGVRLQSFRFPWGPEETEFEATLLRPVSTRSGQRKFLVLCRKMPSRAAGSTGGGTVEILEGFDFCCSCDQDFTLVRIGKNTLQLAGYTQAELHSRFNGRLIELILPEDRPRVREKLLQHLSTGTGAQLEYRVRHKDGSILQLINRSHLIRTPQGQELLYCYLTDITHTKAEAAQLSEKLSRYEIILAQTENVLFEWDTLGDTISFSDTWEKIFGFPPPRKNIRNALYGGSFFHPDDLPILLDKLNSLEGGSAYEMAEVRIATDRGRYLWCRFRASAIRNEQGKLSRIAGIIINIDLEKQEERALQDRAERDALTRLLNKHTGRKQIEEYLAQYPQGVNCALMIIDLDDFKRINDTHGHLFGDAVLTRIARELKRHFRSQDILSRIGGDEFVVLMRGTSDRILVENRCRRLISAIGNAFRSQPMDITLGCSIGVVLAPEHGTSYYELFQRADEALYRAKSAGKNTCVFYSREEAPARSGSYRATAVNNHIDSDEQPGLADDSMVRHAFQRLYSSQNVTASIHDILAMVGRQMNVSRVYIFENSPDNLYCSNTYEWCNEGIQPEIRNLQNVSYITDIPGYEDNFNEDGIFYCPDITVLPQQTYEILEPQGIKSMLQCAIREGGVFRGYIGFDECVAQRWWTKEQIQALTFFSEMLSVFLLKKQEQDLALQQARDLSSILDNQNAWIYIIDPDTCQLKYLNAKTRSLAPHAKPGMYCYRDLMGQSQRCENCPSLKIREVGTANACLYNSRFDLNVLAEATLIQWQGEESCLLTCREV